MAPFEVIEFSKSLRFLSVYRDLSTSGVARGDRISLVFVPKAMVLYGLLVENRIGESLAGL